MKTKVILLSIIVACVGIFIALVKQNIKLRNENAIQTENVYALSNTVKRYIVDDSLKAVKIQGLTLSLNDLKQVNSKLYDNIKKLDVKNKNLESVVALYQQQITNNKDSVRVETIVVKGIVKGIVNDTTIQRFEWHNDWNRIRCEIQNNTILPGKLQLNSRDSIYFATQIKYKRYWYTFWKRTPIGVQIDALNMNPNSEITGSDYIKLRK